MFNLEEYWLDCLKLLLDSKENMLVGVHKFITNNSNESRGEYSQLIYNGVYDLVEYPLKSWSLHDYVTQLDDDSQIYDDLYGDWTVAERLCNYSPYDMEMGDNIIVNSVNQLDIICRELIKDKGSGRAVATLYAPHIDDSSISIPNLQFLQFLIKGDNLFLIAVFSEHDLFNDFIKDILMLKYIGLSVVEVLEEFYPDIKLHMIDYSCGKLYIDEADVKDVERVVEANE